MTAKVCLFGPSGRMGHALLAAMPPELQLGSAVDREGAPVIGTEIAPGIRATSDLAAGLSAADVYIDFTTPSSTLAAARTATSLQKAAVIGTTGLDSAARDAIAALSEVAPVVFTANYSLGVNVVLGLVKRAARALGPTWDPEVVEIHHKMKRDAPSGTAIQIAQAIAAGLDADYDAAKIYARAGDVGPRKDGELGVMAIRGGDVVGEHTAFFFGVGERVEVSHRATNRAIFAIGAMRAAAWVVNQPPGRYDMLDVLGLA
jgi:4-hydroxy-tetrahydrodipicolinate reductase